MPRLVVPGVPHHITQRGVRRYDVFLEDPDRKLYLKLLEHNANRYHLLLEAYSLMSNHVHIVAVPEYANSIAKTFQVCHGSYASYFNQKYEKSGHVWQARPFSCVLDETHFWAAVRYVERNPVRAGITRCAEDYPWSSAPAHCGRGGTLKLDPNWPPNEAVPNWSKWLSQEDPLDVQQRIRERTFRGRPCGNEAFLKNVEVGLRHMEEPTRVSRPADDIYL